MASLRIFITFRSLLVLSSSYYFINKAADIALVLILALAFFTI
jgi:hypothetical protein